MTLQAKLAFAALLAGTAALTLPAAAREPARFDAMDTNGDGFIDMAEVTAAQDARFAEADANGDGALDAAEMAAFHEARKAERADRRGHRAAQRFEAVDTNKDGSISREEYDAAVKSGESRREGWRAKRHDKRQARMMERIDANGDGLIQKEELSGGFVTRMFERMDADEDGRISKAEAEDARGFMKRRHAD